MPKEVRKMRSIAFPGLPIIFAEGFKDYEKRISYHDSIGLAITSIDGTVRTETTAEKTASGISFSVDNHPVSGKRAEGMLKIVKKMTELAGYSGGLKISSRNYNILSGSSDSGAAALVTALNGLLDLNLDTNQLLPIARSGSETAFRSLCGGLTEYRSGKARQLPDFPVSIFAVPFDLERFSADQLHLSVVKHPNYKKRASTINKRIEEFKAHLKVRDIIACLNIMESDAREVHRMFAETGHPVIKPEMRKLCDRVENLRKKGLNCHWNVAGGSCVYVFCPQDEKEELRKQLTNAIEYKCAGGARVI